MALRQQSEILHFGDLDRDVAERHGLLDMYERWRGWSDGAFAPPWRAISLLSFPDVFRRGAMVADCLPGSDDYIVRYWGIDLATAFGEELTSKKVSDCRSDGIMRSFRETAHYVVRHRAPMLLSHRIVPPSGIERTFPTLRLPLSDDGINVTKIMTLENIQMCLRSLGVVRY